MKNSMPVDTTPRYRKREKLRKQMDNYRTNSYEGEELMKTPDRRQGVFIFRVECKVLNRRLAQCSRAAIWRQHIPLECSSKQTAQV